MQTYFVSSGSRRHVNYNQRLHYDVKMLQSHLLCTTTGTVINIINNLMLLRASRQQHCSSAIQLAASSIIIDCKYVTFFFHIWNNLWLHRLNVTKLTWLFAQCRINSRPLLVPITNISSFFSFTLLVVTNSTSSRLLRPPRTVTPLRMRVYK